MTYSDPEYVMRQYRNTSKLNARIALHESVQHQYLTGCNAWIFDHFELPEEASILDVGCGPARLWNENLHRLPKRWDITLTDASPGMIAEPRVSLGSDPRFAFRVEDVQHLPFESENFDAVVANHMLYHVPDRPKALSEISRVLRSSGTLYATTNGEHMHRRNRLDAAYPRPLSPPATPTSRTPPDFSLENGAEQLSPYFSHVTLQPYAIHSLSPK